MIRDMNQYITEAARTDSDKFFDKVAPADAMQQALVELMAACKKVDMVKKGLFYGRQSNDLFSFVTKTNKGNDYEVDGDYLHAILGIITEAGELGEILWKHQLLGDDIELSDPKIKDESGDLLWYVAKLFRRLGVTFEEVGELNIRKLSARFPDKFTTDLANTRNAAVEDAVFH